MSSGKRQADDENTAESPLKKIRFYCRIEGCESANFDAERRRKLRETTGGPPAAIPTPTTPVVADYYSSRASALLSNTQNANDSRSLASTSSVRLVTLPKSSEFVVLWSTSMRELPITPATQPPTFNISGWSPSSAPYPSRIHSAISLALPSNQRPSRRLQFLPAMNVVVIP